MTKEERKLLRERVTSSPEEWSSFLDQMDRELAEEKSPGVYQKLHALYELRDKTLQEINDLHEAIGWRSSGPVSGEPYARAYMVLYDLPNMSIANQVMLNFMYPDDYPVVPGYSKEELLER